MLLDVRLGALVKDRLTKEVANGTTRFVIEGFPRDLPQALGLESEVSISKFLPCVSFDGRVGLAVTRHFSQEKVDGFSRNR